MRLEGGVAPLDSNVTDEEDEDDGDGGESNVLIACIVDDEDGDNGRRREGGNSNDCVGVGGVGRWDEAEIFDSISAFDKSILRWRSVESHK